MGKSNTTSGLFQRLLARPAPALLDAADYGTAFGLEISLDQPDEDPVPAAPTPWRAPTWVQRLTSRGKGSI